MEYTTPENITLHKRWALKNAEHLKAYQAEYDSRPEVKARKAAAARERRKREDVKKRERASRIKRADALREWQRERMKDHATKERYKAYRQTPAAKARRADRVRLRRSSSPWLTIDNRISSSLHKALDGKKAGRSWERLLGYTVSDLCAHIEKQFVGGMGWHNMSEWHIDHIVAKASFPRTEDGMVAAWALPNLRPLWAPKNLEKGAKQEFLI